METKGLNKKLFYESFEPFKNKYLPIFFDMPISKEEKRFRIVFSWKSEKPDGKFNPIMSCQLIDTSKDGANEYIVPDLIFDCIENHITTDFKLYKYLNNWIINALKNYEG